ncbi:MAG: cation:proton antiporter [Planctomycetes bacterium]|nr:cation:proton antiporter [Planctomycetota bacterium]
MGNPIKKEGQTDQAVLAGEKIEKELPPQLPQERKPLLVPEKEPSTGPSPETPPSTLTGEKQPHAPGDLAPTKDFIPTPVTNEREKSPAVIVEERPSGGEPHQAVPTASVEEKPPVKESPQGMEVKKLPDPPEADIAEEQPQIRLRRTEKESSATVEAKADTPTGEPPPMAVSEKPSTVAPAQAPVIAEPEYLAPTKDLKQPPTVEEKPGLKEPPKPALEPSVASPERSEGAGEGMVEAEKTPEKPPAEGPPPAVTTKEPPQARKVEEIHEKPPVAEIGVEKEMPPDTVKEALTAGVVKEEGVEPLAVTPKAPEEPAVTPESVKKIEEVRPETPQAVEVKKLPEERPIAEGQKVEKETPPPSEEKILEEVVREGERVEPLAVEPVTPEEPSLPELLIKEIKPTWEIWQVEPFEYMLLGVAITLIAGKVGGGVARLLRVPEVVGKVIIGMLLGNLYFLTGWNFFNFLRIMPLLENLSYFGALTLLLSAGLHTDLRSLLRVGVSSVLVCLGGIVVPAGLGFLVGHFLLPGVPVGPKLILAIILCCSSTGLILAILQELKVINTLEGKVLTGAVILTEVIVILTFGIVSGVVVRGGIPIHGVVATIGIVLAFLAVIIVPNLIYAERLKNFLTRKVPEGLKISIAAILCLLLAFLAGSIGLVAIIGAFAAGLFLRHMRLIDSDGREYSVDWLIRPAYMLLVPIFFVWVGARVDWESMLNAQAVFLGLAITGVAFLGKFFCSVCPIEPGINRLAIGVGMIIKLEGVLILSGISRKMGILDEVVFSSLIMVVVLTSIVAPLLLKLTLSRKERPVPVSPLSFHV